MGFRLFGGVDYTGSGNEGVLLYIYTYLLLFCFLCFLPRAACCSRSFRFRYIRDTIYLYSIYSINFLDLISVELLSEKALYKMSSAV